MAGFYAFDNVVREVSGRYLADETTRHFGLEGYRNGDGDKDSNSNSTEASQGVYAEEQHLGKEEVQSTASYTEADDGEECPSDYSHSKEDDRDGSHTERGDSNRGLIPPSQSGASRLARFEVVKSGLSSLLTSVKECDKRVSDWYKGHEYRRQARRVERDNEYYRRCHPSVERLPGSASEEL